MKKTLPLILNSILFAAGMYAIVSDKPLLCAFCLLAISLLFIWKPRPQQTSDKAPLPSDVAADMLTLSDGTLTDPVDTPALHASEALHANEELHTNGELHANGDVNMQQFELSLRVQELTETNQLLNEELRRLRHPIYSCPLTSALPVNLNDFFTDYIRVRFDTARNSRIHPKFHCSAPEAQTYLSSAALKIICDNVVDNMLKFSPAAKDLHETIYIRITDLDGDSLIIFKNEGEGLPEHETSLVFDLNYQGSNKKSGTGLGLAQVNALVSDYGGRTWAKSSRNTGFTLYIQLPVKPNS